MIITLFMYFTIEGPCVDDVTTAAGTLRVCVCVCVINRRESGTRSNYSRGNLICCFVVLLLICSTFYRPGIDLCKTRQMTSPNGSIALDESIDNEDYYAFLNVSKKVGHLSPCRFG